MFVVIDSNVIISSLLRPNSKPAVIISAWRAGGFTMLTATQQIEELRTVSRYPKIKNKIRQADIGSLINEMRNLAEMVDHLPKVDISPDPYDNYLLSIASGGGADYLVTGDKRDVLSIKKYSGTSILSVADFIKKIQK